MRPSRTGFTPRTQSVPQRRGHYLIAAVVGCVLAGSAAGLWFACDSLTGDELAPTRTKRVAIRSRTSRKKVAPSAAAPPVTLAAAAVPASPEERQAEAQTRTIIFGAATADPAPAAASPAAPASSSTAVPATMPAVATSAGPLEGIEIVSVDDDIRYVPTTRPALPVAQHPPEATPENVDTGKPIHEWQRMTDDWWGARPWLDDHGISIQANITMDTASVLSGGTGSGTEFQELFNLNATVDTERLLKWKGGTFFINFQNHSGNPVAGEVGDLQGTSNIDAGSFNQISELWYQQALLDDRVRLKVGKFDANVDFNHTPDADSFINGSFGASPLILGFPTYPNPAMGVTLLVKPTEHTYVEAGVFDGSTLTHHPTGTIGPAGFFGGADGMFYIAEAGVDWTVGRGLDGRFSVGGWYHTAEFDKFDGGTASNSTGPYVMLDQKLWREDPDKKDDEQGLGLFVKYAYADADVSPIGNQVATGIAWTGLIPTRDDDTFGLGVSWCGLSGQAGFAHNSETVYEMFYRARLNTWFSIQPDIQYIANPADGGTADAVVGTLRVMIDF